MKYFWLTIGFGGQTMFSARFLVQWIASERAGKSVVPLAFWLFSVGGSAMLLTYAIYRRDPVFILGQSTGSLIYLRNLHFIFRERRQQETDGEQQAAVPTPEQDAEKSIDRGA